VENKTEQNPTEKGSTNPTTGFSQIQLEGSNLYELYGRAMVVNEALQKKVMQLTASCQMLQTEVNRLRGEAKKSAEKPLKPELVREPETGQSAAPENKQDEKAS